jgi:hypothetical protein
MPETFLLDFTIQPSTGSISLDVPHLTQPTTAAVARIVQRIGPRFADVADLSELVMSTGALPAR